MAENSYHKLAPDAYAEHLSQVNERNEVRASEDIYNANGVLLAKQGKQIDPKMAQKLVQHRLTKSLEEQVKLAEALDGKQIARAIDDYRQSIKVIEPLNDQGDLSEQIAKACQWLEQAPVLTQKLTILKEQLPESFDKALFCAWLSLPMAQALNFDEESRTAVFIASLCHDIGLLHIDPAIAQKTEAFSKEEWKAIKAHPIIGQMVLDGQAGVPEIATRAVAEHHERCTGSGYPKHLCADELELVGQTVALLDSFHPILSKRFEFEGRPLLDIIPILQVNDGIFDHRAVSALIRLLRNSNPPSGFAAEAIDSEAIDAIIKDYDWICCALRLSIELDGCLDPNGGRSNQAVHHMVDQLWRVVISSGILTASVRDLLIEAQKASQADVVVREVQLLSGEIRYQLMTFIRELTVLSTEELCLRPSRVGQAREITDKLLSLTKDETGDTATPPETPFDAFTLFNTMINNRHH